MELLSPPVLDALQVCADPSSVSDPQFQTLIDTVVSCILDTSKAGDFLSKHAPSDMDVSLLKQSYPAIMVLFLEAAKADASVDQLLLVLDDCGFSPARKEILQNCYQLNKQKIREKLALVGKGPPHVVDVDWRLDYNLKNDQLNKVMDLQYTVAFKTEKPASEKNTDVQFSCTREQLQDLVGKLKEAVKAVERASQS